MIKKELITKFLNKYKTKISSITFFINSIYQQNIFLYKIILQAGAPSWRNVYQVVSQLNPWIGSFFNQMKHYMWTKQDPPYAEAFLKLYDIALHAPFSEFQGLQSEAVTFEVSSLKKWSIHPVKRVFRNSDPHLW